MKLYAKTALLFSLCLSCVFVLFLGVIQTKMKEFETRQIEGFNEQLIESRASEVGSWIYQRVAELRMIAQEESFQKAETLNTPQTADYLARVNESVANLYGSASKETYLFVNAAGIGWTQDGVRLDVSEREYFLEAMAADESTEYTLSKPLISKLDGQRSVFICYPLRDAEQNKIGYLLGSVTVERMNDILSGIQIFNGTTWVMDRYGRIIAEDENHLEDSILCPYNLSLNKVSDELQKANFSLVEIDLTKGTGQLMASNIPYTDGWRLCALAEKSVIYENLTTLQRSILIVWAVLLIGAFGLSLILARSVTRPVQTLQEAMKEVEKGNLDISYEAPRGHDEVAALGTGFLSMVEQIRTLLYSMQQESQAKRRAELQVLQTQINPHFLYNTLDTLQWKALEHNAVEVADIINSLSSFFRISLSKGKEMITLDEELEHVYHYLFIQQMRYRSILDFDLKLQSGLEKVPTIKLILQPVVENAIYHGLKPKNEKGMIQVNIWEEDEKIFMRVDDNGAGMSPERLAALKENMNSAQNHLGYGLYNVNERIRLTYGEEYGVSIKSELGLGTSVTLCIPYNKSEKEEDDDTRIDCG